MTFFPSVCHSRATRDGNEMAFGIIFMVNQKGRVDALFPRSSLMLGCTLMDRSLALGFPSCQCQMWSMIVGYVPSADNQIYFFPVISPKFFNCINIQLAFESKLIHSVIKPMLLLSMISMQGSENIICMKYVTFPSYLQIRDAHKMLIPTKEFLQLSMILLTFHFSRVKVYHVILLNINDFCITAVLKILPLTFASPGII